MRKVKTSSCETCVRNGIVHAISLKHRLSQLSVKLPYIRRKKVARRGGFSGGMPGNMNNLMKQAQKMQRQMEENQKALEEAEFKSTSGGGAVEVTVNGKKEVTKLTIDPEAVDPEDVEMLEDMIIAALNEAFRQVDDQKAKMMGQFGGGMGGLGSGLF